MSVPVEIRLIYYYALIEGWQFSPSSDTDAIMEVVSRELRKHYSGSILQEIYKESYLEKTLNKLIDLKRNKKTCRP